MSISKIISGGQTGVDRAALDVAIALGIKHGGWCPKGRLSETGIIPAHYLLTESNSDQYDERTALNVRDSDGTLILVPQIPLSHTIQDGTLQTLVEVEKQHKPFLQIDLSKESDIIFLKRWLEENNIKTLNIAGPRESSSPGIYQKSVIYLRKVLHNMPNKTLRIIQISDLHISADPEKKYHGAHPYQNLRKIIQHIKKLQPQFLILTGDISDDGSQHSYELVGQSLAELTMPKYAIPGNHDNPEQMQKTLPLFDIQLEKEINLNEKWHILLLSSYKKAQIWGYLSESELEFLKNKAAALQQKSIFIFLHHHPVLMHSWLDKYTLKNSENFLNIINNYPNIKVIGFGHVHQAFDQTLSGLQYLAAPSTAIQFLPQATNCQFDNLTPGFRVFDIQGNNYETDVVRLA
jgi:Icc protein